MQASTNTPSLGTVVREYTSIRVDDYQRTYAWTRDEITELFDDLKDSADTGENHFFGTLIFQSPADSTEATIVDGQQRLTTMFVLMAALRDEVTRLGIDTLPKDDDAGRRLPVPVVNKIWDFLYVDQDDEKPRFFSNRFLESIFEKSIYPERKNQAKIVERDMVFASLTLAFRKGVSAVREILHDDLESGRFETPIQKLERINAFVDAISSRFLVLRVSTHNITESLEIFLTLNNRGLPLGASDLVRGDIISKIGEDETEATKVKLHRQIFEEWSDTADAVKEVEVFLRHWLVATSEDKVQKKKVYDFVSKRLKDPTIAGRKAKATALWRDIQTAGEVYAKIIDPKTAKDSRISKSAQLHLELLNGYWKSHRILLLSVLGAEIDSANLDQVIRQIFVLCFRWTMSGGNAQVLESLFQKLGNDFKNSKSPQSLIQALKVEAAKLSAEKIDLYLDESIDDGYIGRAILYCLNRSRAEKAHHIDLSAALHLEHIAPQTPTDGWKADVFDGTESLYPLYEKVTSRIGNLTLLDHKINSSIKQWPFRDPRNPDKCKSDEYRSSVILMTRDLTVLKKWDQVEIDLRSDYMKEAFQSVFGVEPGDGMVPPYDEWRSAKGF